MKKRRTGIILRQLRKEAKLTQSALANRIKRPQSYISKYENAEVLLEPAEIARICKALGITFRRFAELFSENNDS